MRITRSLNDMLLKGVYKGTVWSKCEAPATFGIQTFKSGSKEYSIDYRCNDAIAAIDIPAKPVDKGRLFPTGERLMYGSPSQLLATLDRKVQAPVDYSAKQVKVSKRLTAEDIRRVYIDHGTHELINRQDWLQANSIDNVLLPTAANYLCPKCGHTVNCKCDTYDRQGRKIT